jgi:hypothetical protein
MRALEVDVTTYHDDVSDDQDENLQRIVDFHNAQGQHDLDISVHFNSATFSGSNQTNDPVGCEVFFASSKGKEWASEFVNAICDVSGLINRGAKDGDLYFLNNTAETAVLLEICFVNSKADVNIYNSRFDAICRAIAQVVADAYVESDVLFSASGTCSTFGGPDDEGVSPSEGLAFLYEVDDKPYLFLPRQPPGTTGLARRLNTRVHYVACRWDYDVTPKEMLRGDQMALVRAVRTGIALTATPADWGPHEEKTGRAADLSDSLMADLGITTDDEVEVIYPYRESSKPELS